jgi:hypothetical protein
VLYRRLVEANPARFEPDLARSLNELAIRLAKTGDPTGARAASTRRSPSFVVSPRRTRLALSLTSRIIWSYSPGSSPTAVMGWRRKPRGAKRPIWLGNGGDLATSFRGGTKVVRPRVRLQGHDPLEFPRSHERETTSEASPGNQRYGQAQTGIGGRANCRWL